MPTVQQLPSAQPVTSADLLPISQSGTLCAVSTGDLLAGMQPVIEAPTGSLLGRLSLGPGGPEAIVVGQGLELQSGTLAASTIQISTLPVATSLAGTDLVAVSQGGTNSAISLANLLDGQTIDQASAAAAASDSDTVWVAQGGSTMLRQSFSAIWTWIAGNLPTYRTPVLELTTDTTLDGSVHNGRILVCSQPLMLSPAFPNMGSGFTCDVINLSGGNVTLGAGIIASSGQDSLGPNQFAVVRALTFSQGNVVFAAVINATAEPPATVPGAVTGLSVSGITASGATLSWTAPTSAGAVSGYSIQYSIAGATSSSSVSVAGTITSASLTGLSGGSTYTATVSATNASGNGTPSSAVTFTTSAAASSPGQPTNLAVSDLQAASVQLSWSAPTTGGAATGYTIQYSPAGSDEWTTYASGVAGLSTTVTGLSAGTTYDFQVIAVNSGGASSPSAVVSASTPAGSNSVSSITWNLAPAPSYAVGSGAIGVNVHVAPSNAPVQFGLATSSAVAPTIWTAGTNVNTDLWGAYVPVPALAGTYYLWCEGTDGSSPAVYSTAIAVS